MTEKFYGYLHGHLAQEEKRLRDQARFLEADIFQGIDFSKCSNLLELGCGVGAQTEILFKHFPHLRVTAVDHSSLQIERAQSYFDSLPQRHSVTFLKASAEKLPFRDQEFKAAFVCWLLEHLPHPLQALKELHRVLSPGSQLICTEVMNSSLFLWPECSTTRRYWEVYNGYQVALGGDPQVGAKLGLLLSEAGFKEIKIKPLFFLLDKRNPEKKIAMLDYWTELMLSAAPQLVEKQLLPQNEVEEMRKEMENLKTYPESVFSYTSLQASCQA